MLNIVDGRSSPDEVMQYMRKNGVHSDLKVVSTNSYEFNNGLGPYYDYWPSIKHPITGERLHAVRGYVGESHNNDGCYYAEYVDDKGNYYSYVHQFPIRDNNNNLLMEEKNIGQQQYEDKQLREKSNFADIVNKYHDEHKSVEQKREEFYSNTKIGNYLRSIKEQEENQNKAQSKECSIKRD